MVINNTVHAVRANTSNPDGYDFFFFFTKQYHDINIPRATRIQVLPVLV